MRANADVRFLARKIRRVYLRRLYLNLLAGLNLDQRLGSRAILPISLAPDLPAQHVNIVVQRHSGARTRPTWLAFAQLMGVIELISSHPGLNFEPACSILGAREQRAVRTGNLGILAVRDGIADEIVGRLGL